MDIIVSVLDGKVKNIFTLVRSIPYEGLEIFTQLEMFLGHMESMVPATPSAYLYFGQVQNVSLRVLGKCDCCCINNMCKLLMSL